MRRMPVYVGSVCHHVNLECLIRADASGALFAEVHGHGGVWGSLSRSGSLMNEAPIAARAALGEE